MICIIALVVFSVLGLFSLTYRNLAKEAFDCVFRRITLRPCNTGFDQKMKAWIIGPLLRKNIKVAGFVNRYFEIISWVFVITFFISLFWSAQAGYNLIRYKTCNPEDPQSCVLTPAQLQKCQCQEGQINCQDLGKDVCKEGKCDKCDICKQ